MIRNKATLLAALAMAMTIAFSGAGLADEGIDCEFPAQSVQLERPVLITASVPQVADVQADACGNVIGYTEQMTRTIGASQWVPTAPPLESPQGPLRPEPVIVSPPRESVPTWVPDEAEVLSDGATGEDYCLVGLRYGLGDLIEEYC